MKNLIETLKKYYKTWLPIAFLTIVMIATIVFQVKYWPLQPLWKTYLFVFVSQLICWVVINFCEQIDLSKTELGITMPVKTGYIIGLVWSVIQVFWLKQWWAWLNLLSQPFIYALIAFLLIKIQLISIDRLNKIRHHNDG